MHRDKTVRRRSPRQVPQPGRPTWIPVRDVLTCARREVYEESGLTTNGPWPLRGTVLWTGFGTNRGDYLCFVFRADSFTGTPHGGNEEGTLEWGTGRQPRQSSDVGTAIISGCRWFSTMSHSRSSVCDGPTRTSTWSAGRASVDQTACHRVLQWPDGRLRMAWAVRQHRGQPVCTPRGFEHRVLEVDWWGLVNAHSLGWVCARRGVPELVGFVNVCLGR